MVLGASFDVLLWIFNINDSHGENMYLQDNALMVFVVGFMSRVQNFK